MPVYAVGALDTVSRAADFHQQDIMYRSVCLVREKPLGYGQLVAMEQFRSMTLLTRFAGRAQSVNRRGNRGRVGRGRNSQQLSCTGNLRFDKPVGTGTDV